jgi:tetratricopeptide (TPR) repeat protein
MDLTTLAGALLVALGILGADAVMNANSVMVEVVAPPKIDNVTIDRDTLEEEFDSELFAIARIASVLEPPEIHASRDQGLGVALAKELKLEDVAYALQSELGYKKDRLRLALYLEDGALRALVSGYSSKVGSFRQVLIPSKDEKVLAFVHRCAIWGASQLSPYTTALYLLQKHATDGDFSDVVALVHQSNNKLPATPISFDRSAFDNLLGIVALLKSDAKGADSLFKQAVADYPANPVAVLNAGFTELQQDDYKAAAARMQQLVSQSPPTNKILLATAYSTWAAAMVGLHDLDRADQLLQQATSINPDGSIGWSLLSEVMILKGNKEAAAAYHERAMLEEATFENYAEVAALYFQLSWKDNEPLIRSNFSNPSVVTFH